MTFEATQNVASHKYSNLVKNSENYVIKGQTISVLLQIDIVGHN